MITELSISENLRQQRIYFSTGKSKEINFRLQQLKTLKQLIIDNELVIIQALQADLQKPELEAVTSEIILALKEIELAIKNLRNWAKPKKAAIPWQLLPASAQITPEPLGVVLIIGAWNYPFELVIVPLIGAIAAGNCAVLKPSEISTHTSHVLAEIIPKYFDSDYISVIAGGVETSQKLLAEKFDHIFFTGSPHVGKIVMAAAAKHLTPVTLELGGKNPCIVDTDIHFEHTARRIIWGKFINAGQTCIAPDYLLVNKKIKDKLLINLEKCLKEFYGDSPDKSPDYARIINQQHFDRLVNFLKNAEIIVGGENKANEFYIAPTLIQNVSFTDSIMQEEIFGPILPIIEYTDIEEAINWVNSQPKPLAIYLFSENEFLQKQVLQATSSGAVCFNETVIHFTVPSLPFGGVGNSGIGSYHGKSSFDTFSHYKSILKNPFWVDIKLRYAPYKGKLSILRQLLKF
ncbi:aldehyde dehydrogenase [Anabaena cylindrica FACHB-243]|uniref:Aldehyde dehydrogenase n=1 Tax=Anabaena cylindrica (strain ATCC 27899 / PCC 7122) TaxID=272123 RepID=K9ZNV1_ANACC|nr:MULTISPECIES: aldehyde dehydrogenase [Anabaena]AFZ60881.1 Aldehyde Dehydrogenase [Anabaena cylindrica PCC 7122]MBD2420500.1 aldehyde dehydrogenase [Anabaena cylindrica FACHB-243]MBY5284642.1 aldehyde dehydrogenase [Anabaena sp. CCAP 1446/1C]MBY5309723.1 aldehyde dehydrogenase [Anabaena sp. CCAP 1446/1C]MCM2406876.1 aldehyde dehydrogenase [Anabaena sp. CCAP 1446/1C]